MLSQPRTPGLGVPCLAKNPIGSGGVPGAPLMQGLPLQVQAIPGSVGSAKVVLQLQAVPNMPAVHSMTASLATRPQRRLPKQPSAPCTPGARLAAVAAAAECWDDELTWARRCVSVPGRRGGFPGESEWVDCGSLHTILGPSTSTSTFVEYYMSKLLLLVAWVLSFCDMSGCQARVFASRVIYESKTICARS